MPRKPVWDPDLPACLARSASGGQLAIACPCLPVTVSAGASLVHLGIQVLQAAGYESHYPGWELCLDWVRPFQKSTYSVGVLGIRACLSDTDKNKSFNAKILAVMPPNTANVDSMLRRTLAAFERMGYGESPLRVRGQVQVDGGFAC